jgi:hypothetical protein
MCCNEATTWHHDDSRRQPETQKKNFSGGNFKFISNCTGAGDGTKELFNISPVETSIKFDLPTQSSLSDSIQSSPQFSTNVNNVSFGTLQIFYKSE